MKINFLKFLVLTLLSITLFSCNNDDGGSNSYPESIVGTVWHRQQTANQSGQSVVIDFYISFETSNSGNLEAETTAAGTNISNQYDFTYTYSNGNGVANFEDSNIGTQNFTIRGNKLKLDGEELTKI
jgi:hypothetical protein